MAIGAAISGSRAMIRRETAPLPKADITVIGAMFGFVPSITAVYPSSFVATSDRDRNFADKSVFAPVKANVSL
jgi:hypothetical protein